MKTRPTEKLGRKDAAKLCERMLDGHQFDRIASLMCEKPEDLYSEILSGNLPAWKLFELSYFCAHDVTSKDRMPDYAKFILDQEGKGGYFMDEDNHRYALKVHSGNATYTDGPYETFQDAMDEMRQLMTGDIDTFLTQKGSTVMLSSKGPDSVEIVRFQIKDELIRTRSEQHGNNENR